jgi:LPS sulfotransferase NodH
MHLLKKAIRNPRKALAYGRDRLLSIVGHRDYVPFILLARSRTGSNLLRSYLDSHPNVRIEWRLLARLDGRNLRDVLRAAYPREPRYVAAKGFKMFYNHPQDDESGEVWDALARIDDLHVIHLKRKNILRTLLSRKIAGIQGVWMVESRGRAGVRPRKAVSFTVEELSDGFTQTRNWENTADDRFHHHPMLTLYYEDLVDDPEATIRAATRFLGVGDAEPRTTLIRQNPEALSELITNYRELKEAFEGTEWQEFFDE